VTLVLDQLPPATSAECYEPFDAEYCRGLMSNVIGPIADHYFRPRIIGAEKLPTKGPIILAANHSGTAFPYDAIVFDFALWKRDDLEETAKFRSVFEPELSLVWWMRPFGVDNLWRRGGGVDMTFDNFERLIERGERIIYYPEGVPGIGKGFQNRYQLQRFRTSFALLAARHDVPVYPVSIVNAEWVMPFHATFPPLDRLIDRLFHVPFLPLPAGLLALIVPWLWYLALPAHMTFVIGDRIDVRRVLRAEGINEFEHPDRAALERSARQIRARMQASLDHDAAIYGKRPYAARSLWRALKHAGASVARVLPTGWPLSFVRYDRDRQRPPARNAFHAVLRDIDLAAFYLPFGWPLLTLSRRLRKPPYGYRGLSDDESRERQGAFVWRLASRPLPPRARAPSAHDPTD
jgi:1-acyl-sn-glycerol-3-phosphate acyltransferase